MLSRRSSSRLGFVLRIVPLVLLATAPILGPFQRPAPARAATPPDPAARLQVVIKSVKIFDDHEWFGSGEMHLWTTMWICDVRAAVSPCWRSEDFPPRHYAAASVEFSASSDSTVTLNRVVPQPGDYAVGSDLVSMETGFTMNYGRFYRLQFGMWESDATVVELGQCFTFVLCDPDPSLGEVHMDLNQQSEWGFGTRTMRSVREGGGPGDFQITFEIRRTPLPDLQPTAIELLQNPAGTDSVCLVVENVGEEDAGPFEMAFRIDGQEVPGGTLAAVGLAAGQSGKHCLQTELPRGVHKLSVYVDEDRAVAEMDEYNNRFEREAVIRPPGLAPTGVGTGGDAPAVGDPIRPDLVVTSLKAARDANGSGQCEGGKTNYLFAQVKNVGPVAAGPFAVRVEVSGDLKNEKGSGAGLAAGATMEVTIPTDDLKDGSQPVKVIADGDNQVSEQDEGNNTYQITANCI
jgi:hypothetical protein